MARPGIPVYNRRKLDGHEWYERKIGKPFSKLTIEEGQRIAAKPLPKFEEQEEANLRFTSRVVRSRLLAITALAAALFRLPGRIGKPERHAPPPFYIVLTICSLSAKSLPRRTLNSRVVTDRGRQDGLERHR
jgi:hypothetical protein